MFITGLMNTLSGEETSIRRCNPGAYINVDDIILSALKNNNNTAGSSFLFEVLANLRRCYDDEFKIIVPSTEED